jgi:hypothetical protein
MASRTGPKDLATDNPGRLLSGYYNTQNSFEVEGNQNASDHRHTGAFCYMPHLRTLASLDLAYRRWRNLCNPAARGNPFEKHFR